jgi:RNA polymerase sigma factor for flagellar operon FliA
VPRSVRRKIRDVEEAISTLEAQNGRPASDKEVAAHLNMSEDEYSKTLGKIQCTSILSLNDVWFSGDGNDRLSIQDSIEGPESLNPDVEVERKEMRRIIFDVINQLPEKEKKIIILYHYEELTLREIGRVVELTESRVSQLHTKALLKIRAKLSNTRKGIV